MAALAGYHPVPPDPIKFYLIPPDPTSSHRIPPESFPNQAVLGLTLTGRSVFFFGSGESPPEPAVRDRTLHCPGSADRYEQTLSVYTCQPLVAGASHPGQDVKLSRLG